MDEMTRSEEKDELFCFRMIARVRERWSDDAVFQI